ncbi:MAG: hypothetical protein HOM88_03745 [Hellea sp.]|nr:hypothetical protein [Hellea sp.]
MGRSAFPNFRAALNAFCLSKLRRCFRVAVSGSEEFIFSWLEELIRFRVESNAVLLSALLSEIVLKINSNI